LDYERRISELIGVGAGGEFVFNDHGRVALVGLMVALHPAGGLGLIAGPGLEIEETEHETAGKTFNDSSRETSFAFRVGANYRFEFGGRYSAGPTLYTDFISGKDPVLVWGVSIGTGF